MVQSDYAEELHSLIHDLAGEYGVGHTFIDYCETFAWAEENNCPTNVDRLLALLKRLESYGLIRVCVASAPDPIAIEILPPCVDASQAIHKRNLAIRTTKPDLVDKFTAWSRRHRVLSLFVIAGKLTPAIAYGGFGLALYATISQCSSTPPTENTPSPPPKHPPTSSPERGLSSPDPAEANALTDPVHESGSGDLSESTAGRSLHESQPHDPEEPAQPQGPANPATPLDAEPSGT